MKGYTVKALAAAMICLVAAAAVVPAAAQEKEKSPFRVYLDDKNAENFIKAYDVYQPQFADSADNGALIYLAYMHMTEMNRYLGILEDGLDGLKNPQKFSFGNMLLSLGRYQEAIDVYKVLNEKSPKWSCPWRHRGEAHWKAGEYEDAVMCLEKAIETRETHYDAYVMLAEVLRDMKEYGRALETLEKGLEHYGKDIEDPSEEVSDLDVHFLYHDLLVRNGKDDKAAEILEVIKKIAPDDERLQQL